MAKKKGPDYGKLNAVILRAGKRGITDKEVREALGVARLGRGIRAEMTARGYKFKRKRWQLAVARDERKGRAQARREPLDKALDDLRDALGRIVRIVMEV